MEPVAAKRHAHLISHIPLFVEHAHVLPYQLSNAIMHVFHTINCPPVPTHVLPKTLSAMPVLPSTLPTINTIVCGRWLWQLAQQLEHAWPHAPNLLWPYLCLCLSSFCLVHSASSSSSGSRHQTVTWGCVGGGCGTQTHVSGFQPYIPWLPYTLYRIHTCFTPLPAERGEASYPWSQTYGCPTSSATHTRVLPPVPAERVEAPGPDLEPLDTLHPPLTCIFDSAACRVWRGATAVSTLLPPSCVCCTWTCPAGPPPYSPHWAWQAVRTPPHPFPASVPLPRLPPLRPPPPPPPLPPCPSPCARRQPARSRGRSTGHSMRSTKHSKQAPPSPCPPP